MSLQSRGGDPWKWPAAKYWSDYQSIVNRYLPLCADIETLNRRALRGLLDGNIQIDDRYIYTAPNEPVEIGWQVHNVQHIEPHACADCRPGEVNEWKLQKEWGVVLVRRSDYEDKGITGPVVAHIRKLGPIYLFGRPYLPATIIRQDIARLRKKAEKEAGKHFTKTKHIIVEGLTVTVEPEVRLTPVAKPKVVGASYLPVYQSTAFRVMYYSTPRHEHYWKLHKGIYHEQSRDAVWCICDCGAISIFSNKRFYTTGQWKAMRKWLSTPLSFDEAVTVLRIQTGSAWTIENGRALVKFGGSELTFSETETINMATVMLATI